MEELHIELLDGWAALTYFNKTSLKNIAAALLLCLLYLRTHVLPNRFRASSLYFNFPNKLCEVLPAQSLYELMLTIK